MSSPTRSVATTMHGGRYGGPCDEMTDINLSPVNRPPNNETGTGSNRFHHSDLPFNQEVAFSALPRDNRYYFDETLAYPTSDEIQDVNHHRSFASSEYSNQFSRDLASGARRRSQEETDRPPTPFPHCFAPSADNVAARTRESRLSAPFDQPIDVEHLRSQVHGQGAAPAPVPVQDAEPPTPKPNPVLSDDDDDDDDAYASYEMQGLIILDCICSILLTAGGCSVGAIFFGVYANLLYVQATNGGDMSGSTVVGALVGLLIFLCSVIGLCVIIKAIVVHHRSGRRSIRYTEVGNDERRHSSSSGKTIRASAPVAASVKDIELEEMVAPRPEAFNGHAEHHEDDAEQTIQGPDRGSIKSAKQKRAPTNGNAGRGRSQPRARHVPHRTPSAAYLARSRPNFREFGDSSVTSNVNAMLYGGNRGNNNSGRRWEV